MNRILSFLIVIGGLYAIIGTISKVGAEPLDISLSPDIILETASPSASVSTTITLKNNTDTDVTLQPRIVTLDKTTLSLNESPLSYLTISQNGQAVDKELHLRPQESQGITLDITIPANASASEEYRRILFLTSNSNEVKQTTSKISVGLGAMLLLSVQNPASPIPLNVILDTDTVPTLVFNTTDSFKAKIVNKGQTFVTIKPHLKITDTGGKELISTNLPQRVLLPKEPDDLPINLDNVSFGRYTIETTVLVNEKTTLTSKKELYVIPKNILLMGGSAFTLLFLLVLRVQQIKATYKKKLYRKK